MFCLCFFVCLFVFAVVFFCSEANDRKGRRDRQKEKEKRERRKKQKQEKLSFVLFCFFVVVLCSKRKLTFFCLLFFFCVLLRFAKVVYMTAGLCSATGKWIAKRGIVSTNQVKVCVFFAVFAEIETSVQCLI